MGILRRMHESYGDERFARLASASNCHIHNLRKTRAHRTGRLTFRKTRPTRVATGVHRKPRCDGKPGFLRIDTVHLGGRDGEKGIDLINVVAEVLMRRWSEPSGDGEARLRKAARNRTASSARSSRARGTRRVRRPPSRALKRAVAHENDAGETTRPAALHSARSWRTTRLAGVVYQ